MLRRVVDCEHADGALRPGYHLKLSCGHWQTAYGHRFETRPPPKKVNCRKCLIDGELKQLTPQALVINYLQGKEKDMNKPKLSKHQAFMYETLNQYPDMWHAIHRNQASIRVAKGLQRKGYIEFTDDNCMARVKR